MSLYALKDEKYVIDNELTVVNVLKEMDLVATMGFRKGGLEYSIVFDRKILNKKKEKLYIERLKKEIKHENI